MDKNSITEAVQAVISERGCFLVEVKASAENDIEIIIEKMVGSVDWDDCAAVDKAVHEAFDQDVEDYSLTVSSAGLDRPFKVEGQFRKAMGTKVDVWLKGGKKVKGELKAFSPEAIVVDDATIAMDTVNSVRPLVEFE